MEAFVDNFLGEQQLFDSAEFAPQSKTFITKDVLIFGDFAGDNIQLHSFEQRFSQVPVASTLLLFGLGITGLGYTRKRRQL
jgi:hypothetical protein